jgi:hypothetical protein
MKNFFSFLNPNENTESDNPLAGNSETTPPAGLRVESSAAAKVVAEAERSRPTSDKSGGSAFSLSNGSAGKTDTQISAAANAQLQNNIRALEDLLDPKVWKGAMGAPGLALSAITNKDYWELSDEEKDTLAKTGAATARVLMVHDPRWLALSLFGFSVISIYGSRAVKYFEERRAEKKNALPKAV